MQQRFSLLTSYSTSETQAIQKYEHPLGLPVDICPLIYIYFAPEADLALVLCKHPRKGYQMLQWNTKTDTFTKGQWLLKGKIRAQESFVSQTGDYFKYKLLRREGQSWPRIFKVVSEVPYFTATAISSQDRGSPVHKGFFPKDQKWFPLSLINGQIGELKTSDGTFRIFTDQGQILKDGKVILDLRMEKFYELKK
jgi:hypothetical protein